MKRVLVVATAPPGPDMGWHRMLRIVRRLPEHGYEPVVLTDRDVASDHEPPSAIVQVPYPRVHLAARRVRHRAESALSSQRSQDTGRPGFGMGRWLYITDKRFLWSRGAVRVAEAMAAISPFDLVFATNPAPTSAVAGARMSRALGVPFVLEYRDQWIGSPYSFRTPPTRLHRALAMRAERATIRQAAGIDCLSTGIARSLVDLYGADLRCVPEVHYNMVDRDELAAVSPGLEKPAAFTIAYVGDLYPGRDPTVFLQGLKRFVDRNQIAPTACRFRWLGASNLEGVNEVIGISGVEEYVDVVGVVPHDEALRELLRSHVSLLIQAPTDTVHIPGKTFEAMAAGVPLLAVANPCETTEIIDRTRAGLHCPYDADAVADTLDVFWHQLRDGSSWQPDDDEVARFSVDVAVGRLATLFDTVVGGGSS